MAGRKKGKEEEKEGSGAAQLPLKLTAVDRNTKEKTVRKNKTKNIRNTFFIVFTERLWGGCGGGGSHWSRLKC